MTEIHAYHVLLLVPRIIAVILLIVHIEMVGNLCFYENLIEDNVKQLRNSRVASKFDYAWVELLDVSFTK